MSSLACSNPKLDRVSPLPYVVSVRRIGRFFLIYSTALTLSLLLAYAIRFDMWVPPEQARYIPMILAGVVPLQLFFLYAFHQFHLLPAYFGIPALLRMAGALGCAGLLLAAVRWRWHLGYALPFGVILLDALLGLFFLSGLCYLWRLYRHSHWAVLFLGFTSKRDRRRRVGIIGAGHAGLSLAQELQSNPRLGLHPVAFFDDDPGKWRARAWDIPVVGSPDLLAKGIARSYQIDEIILSMPSAPAIRINQILEIIRRAGLEHKTVPSLGEMAVGKYKVSNLRTVQIEDLLGREPVQLQAEEIRRLLSGRRVMVTGAGGSIGSELCRQVASHSPSQLLLVERSEVQLFVVEQELLRRGHRNVVRALIADVLDEGRIRHIFEVFKPEIIFHAAAHKHVPMMESQPEEAVKNNTFGTALLARLAQEFDVERFVLISTDKAINPTSVMGATKRLAEMLLQDLTRRNHSSTRFIAVRFGNVLGSSGSVVPLFKEQIAAGGPVTVTHPQMTRYFMTIPEAVGLVLQSTVLGQGGEIFVLDMGKPVRILDLAKQMIELCGFEPGKDIRIEFTGVRPGEKLFEEISYSLESVSPTAHPKIMRLRGAPPDSESLKDNLELLESALDAASGEQLKRLLKAAVPEYQFSSPAEKKSLPAVTVATPSRSATSQPAPVAIAQL